MKSYILQSPQKIEMKNLEEKEPEDNEVMIKTMACGICGTDYHLFNGKDLAAKYPVVPGHELSGIVVKTGKNVKYFKNGDHVAVNPNMTCGYCEPCKSGKENFCENLSSVGINYNGGYGEYVTVPQKVVYKVPESMDFIAASMVEPVSCIVHAFDKNPVPLGGSAIILGTGFIGLAFLQLLKGMGYYPVFIMERNKIRNALAKKFGADEIFENIDELMKSDLIGSADLVVEATGDIEILSKTVDMVSKSGKIFAFAVYPPDTDVNINAYKIYNKEISISGDFINPYTMRKAINILNSGIIDYKSMADHIIRQDDIKDIFNTGKKDFVKAVIKY